MDVYLDNNIVVSIEKGDFSLEQIVEILPNGKNKYFYSSSHIFEAESFKGNNSVSPIDFRARRFQTIRKIFNNNYLFINRKEITYIKEDPQVVYETIKSPGFGIPFIRRFTDLISKEQKEQTRLYFGIDSLHLNNLDIDQALEYLNEKINSLSAHQKLTDLIEKSIYLHPGNKDFGLHNRFAAIFEILDLFGYWRDKVTENSDYARLWDGLHCYFASFCDYFISDDKRTRYKSRIAYSVYNKNTKVVSSQGLN